MKLIIHTEFVQWIETLIKWKCWIVGPFVAFYDLAPKPVGKTKKQKKAVLKQPIKMVSFSVKFHRFIRLMHAFRSTKPRPPWFLIGP